MPYRRRRCSEQHSIREVFVHARPSYAAGEVVRILRMTDAELRRAIDDGLVTPLPRGAGVHIPWEDVVQLGLERRWTHRMVAVALSAEPPGGVPRLARVLGGRVELPLYQWKLLQFLAQRQSAAEHRELTASDFIETAVSHCVVAAVEEWDELERAIPGIQAASRWPAGSVSE